MSRMQLALEDLEARKEDIDANIAHQHGVVSAERNSLANAEKRLEDLQKLSASFEEAISFVKAGLQNEKPDSEETPSNG